MPNEGRSDGQDRPFQATPMALRGGLERQNIWKQEREDAPHGDDAVVDRYSPSSGRPLSRRVDGKAGGRSATCHDGGSERTLSASMDYAVILDEIE